MSFREARGRPLRRFAWLLTTRDRDKKQRARRNPPSIHHAIDGNAERRVRVAESRKEPRIDIAAEVDVAE